MVTVMRFMVCFVPMMIAAMLSVTAKLAVAATVVRTGVGTIVAIIMMLLVCTFTFVAPHVVSNLKVFFTSRVVPAAKW